MNIKKSLTMFKFLQVKRKTKKAKEKIINITTYLEAT